MSERKIIKEQISKSISILHKIPGLKKTFKFKTKESKYGITVNYRDYSFEFTIPDIHQPTYDNIYQKTHEFIRKVKNDFLMTFESESNQFLRDTQSKMDVLNIRHLIDKAKTDPDRWTKLLVSKLKIIYSTGRMSSLESQLTEDELFFVKNTLKKKEN